MIHIENIMQLHHIQLLSRRWLPLCELLARLPNEPRQLTRVRNNENLPRLKQEMYQPIASDDLDRSSQKPPTERDNGMIAAIRVARVYDRWRFEIVRQDRKVKLRLVAYQDVISQ